MPVSNTRSIRFCSSWLLVTTLWLTTPLMARDMAQSTVADAAEKGCGQSTRPAEFVPVLVSPGPHTLTLRFLDRISGLPTPVRAGLYTTTGTPIAPAPVEAFFFQNTGDRAYFYCDGSVTLGVPPGDLVIYAAKGFEYIPVTIPLNVTGDTLVTVQMARWVNSRALGWFPGETHTHLTHPPVNYVMEPEDMMMVVRAEELHFANVMDDDEFFTGAPHPLSDPEHVMYFSKEYRNPVFAHLSLLGLTSWIHTANCEPQPGIACGRTLDGRVAEQVHAQPGALMIITHPFPTTDYFNIDPWPGGGVARGTPMDVIGGHADAMDILCYTHQAPPANTEEYYEVLNAGFHLPASAGSDATLTTGWSDPPGGYRLYVKVGDGPNQFTTAKWLEQLAAGATYVSNYPIFQALTVGGVTIGGTVHTDGGPLDGWVVALCALPMDKVEIIADGVVIDVILPTADGRSIFGSFSVPADTTRWVTARAVGSTTTWHVIGKSGLYAETGPIYIEHTGSNPGFVHPKQQAAARYFVNRLEQLQSVFDMDGVFPADSKAAYDSSIDSSLAYYHALTPDPPERFVLESPAIFSNAHGAIVVQTRTPTLRWAESVDNDPGSVVTYTVTYAIDSLFAVSTVVTAVTDTWYTVPEGVPLDDQQVYYWKVDAVDETERVTASTPKKMSFLVDVTVTAVGDTPVIEKWSIGAGRPNPFNPTMGFDYAVPRTGTVHDIDVIDVAGRHVRTLFAGTRPAGRYSMTWDGRDDSGRAVASGIYFIRLKPRGSPSHTRKVVLLK